MLVVTLVMGIVAVIVVYWSARVAMGFGRDVRTAIFRKVEASPRSRSTTSARRR